MAERNTRIKYSQIASVRPNDLDSTNVLGSAMDNYVPSYDLVTGKFTWVEAGGGGVSANDVDDFTIKFVDSKLKIADRIESNILLNAFKIAINGSLSQFGMIDGITDEYEDESGIDTANCINESYNSEGNYYTGKAGGLTSDTKLLLHFDGVDGSKEILDDGNTGHVVTQVGTATLSTSQKKWGSSGLLLDGDSDYLTIPDSSDWDFGTGEFTIDFWSRFNSVASNSTLIDIGYGSNYGMRLLWLTSNELQVYMASNERKFSWTPVVDTWYHIAVTRNGTNLRAFINGTQIGTTLTDNTDVQAGSVGIHIGVDYGINYYFNGYMEEFRISNTARWTSNFTPPTSQYTSDANTKLLLHMNTQDISNSHHILTYQGDAQIDTAQKKWSPGSLQLDGTGDYLSIPDSSDWDIFGSNSDDWTIDLWVKHTDHSGYEMYIGQREGAGNQWVLYHFGGNGLKFEIDSGGNAVTVGYAGEITDTNWHHIAVIKVGTNWGLYKDGIQIAYDSSSSTDTFNGSLYIGYTTEGGNYFSGHMDEIRIQHSNAFSASPDSGNNDTITVPTSSYTETGGNITLISNSFTAESTPDTARIVIFEEDVDTVTLNTDLKAYISRDGGVTWAEVTLADEGDYETDKRILSGIADLTASGIGSGTAMEYKLVSTNDKVMNFHGTGLLWD